MAFIVELPDEDSVDVQSAPHNTTNHSSNPIPDFADLNCGKRKMTPQEEKTQMWLQYYEAMNKLRGAEKEVWRVQREVWRHQEYLEIATNELKKAKAEFNVANEAIGKTTTNRFSRTRY